MRNLFVLHTQYTLVLACGLSKGRFKNDQNDLILFKDFALSKEMKSSLDEIFSETTYLTGGYPSKNKTIKSRLKNYPKVIKQCKKFISKKYDKVFIVTDMSLPEMRIMKLAYSYNSKIEFIGLEDGAYPYFLNYETAGGLDSNNITRTFRKLLFKTILGCGKFYDFEGRFMGANTWLLKMYFTYSDKVRDIYRNKIKEEITGNEFLFGIESLFSAPSIIVENNAILLILDKMDVYKDLNNIKALVRRLVNLYVKQGCKIYYKYHPREELNIEELKGCIELDRHIAIENYFKAFHGKRPLIIGIKSTGLQTAKKIGYNVLSVAKLVNEHTPDVVSFYKSIDIHVIENFQDLENLKY